MNKCHACVHYTQSYTWWKEPLNSGECQRLWTFKDGDPQGFYTTDYFEVGADFGCIHWESRDLALATEAHKTCLGIITTYADEIAKLKKLAGIVEDIWRTTHYGRDQRACAVCHRLWENCGHNESLPYTVNIDGKELEVCGQCHDEHFEYCHQADEHVKSEKVRECYDAAKKGVGCPYLRECGER